MCSLKGEGQGWLRDLLHLCLSFPAHMFGAGSLTRTLHEASPFL